MNSVSRMMKIGKILFKIFCNIPRPWNVSQNDLNVSCCQMPGETDHSYQDRWNLLTSELGIMQSHWTMKYWYQWPSGITESFAILNWAIIPWIMKICQTVFLILGKNWWTMRCRSKWLQVPRDNLSCKICQICQKYV